MFIVFTVALLSGCKKSQEQVKENLTANITADKTTWQNNSNLFLTFGRFIFGYSKMNLG